MEKNPKNPLGVSSEVVLNVTRLLILLSRFSKQKTIKITIDKIMLFDFYMKFPNVMLDNEEGTDQLSFYDYYAYFHWKPNRDEYQHYLRYMIAKKTLHRTINSNDFIYTISDSGSEIVEALSSKYAQNMFRVADYIKKYIAKNSNSKIENEIISKSWNTKKMIQSEGIQYDK